MDGEENWPCRTPSKLPDQTTEYKTTEPLFYTVYHPLFICQTSLSPVPHATDDQSKDHILQLFCWMWLLYHSMMLLLSPNRTLHDSWYKTCSCGLSLSYDIFCYLASVIGSNSGKYLSVYRMMVGILSVDGLYLFREEKCQ